MPILRRRELEKKIRSIRLNAPPAKIRGWDWDSPPVRPPLNLGLGVSELASRYCETMRDIYVRRVLNLKPKFSFAMVRGIIYHEVISKAITDSKRFLFNSGPAPGHEVVERLLPEAPEVVRAITADLDANVSEENETGGDLEGLIDEAVRLYKYVVVQVASNVDRILSKHPWVDLDSLVAMSVPPITERLVDGSLIGLSQQLRVDLYSEGSVVTDIKTGEPRDFHRLAPTGYALALEADQEVPVDFGIIAYVKVGKWPTFRYEVFPITDELRTEFLTLRDEAIAIISNEEDPGKPLRCPDSCPFREVCP